MVQSPCWKYQEYLAIVFFRYHLVPPGENQHKTSMIWPTLRAFGDRTPTPDQVLDSEPPDLEAQVVRLQFCADFVYWSDTKALAKDSFSPYFLGSFFSSAFFLLCADLFYALDPLRSPLFFLQLLMETHLAVATVAMIPCWEVGITKPSFDLSTTSHNHGSVENYPKSKEKTNY